MKKKKKRVHQRQVKNKKRNRKSKKLNPLPIKKTNPMADILPEIHVAIGYKDVFDDYDTVNPHDLVKGIPSILLLHNMAILYNRVKYALSDTATQRKMLRDIEKCVPVREKNKIRSFYSRHKAIFITQETVAWFYRLVLSNFTNTQGIEQSLELSSDEKLRFYKAILYCNQGWTDRQSQHLNGNADPIELSMLIDVPISEFKQHKDFKTQLYKAGQFFLFCEKNAPYDVYLKDFLADKKVATWQEYLLRLFDFFTKAINHIYVKFAPADKIFFYQYCIDVNDPNLCNLWNDPAGQNFLRDRFILSLPNDMLLLLDDNYLVDKMYQSMQFDLYNSAKKNHKLGQFPDFKSKLCTVFSEPHLLYPLMQNIFDGKATAMFSGEEMKAAGIVGEPDYYVRQGEYLYLFEFKDALFSDKAKLSNDVEAIKEEIIDKTCCDKVLPNGRVKQKGAGQLLRVIDDIRNKHLYDKLDPGISLVKGIAPIIVTTDPAFSANGVNIFMVKEYEKLQKKYVFGEIFVQIPLILDYDTLVKISYALHTGRYLFFNLIWSYIFSKKRIGSFKAYVDDNILRGVQSNEAENKFLFKDIISDEP